MDQDKIWEEVVLKRSKMSLGTLFVTQHARSIAPRALAKHLNLDVKVSDWEDPAYKANFPLGKVPAFLGPKGFKLHEVIAVALYCKYNIKDGFNILVLQLQGDEKYSIIYTVIPVLRDNVENT